jgi:hypothetical protein
MPSGVSPACASRAANFSRESTSSSSANGTSLAHSSNSPALAASSNRRGSPPAEITPETSRFVSTTMRNDQVPCRAHRSRRAACASSSTSSSEIGGKLRASSLASPSVRRCCALLARRQKLHEVHHLGHPAGRQLLQPLDQLQLDGRHCKPLVLPMCAGSSAQ